MVLGGAGWLGFKSGRDEAEELFDARLATSARVLDILVAQQVEIATVDDPIVIDIPAPLKDPFADPDESAASCGSSVRSWVAASKFSLSATYSPQAPGRVMC